MSHLAMHLLGSPRVELDGEELHIPRRKAIALLTYLAVESGRHSRDTLATLLWPEYDQRGARADLRRTLSLLSRTLGRGWLVADRETAGLNPDADLWLDEHAFRQRLSTRQAHDHPPMEVCQDCVSTLKEAVALYRDDFLAGFTLRDSLAFDEWQFFQTERLKDQLASALERLIRWYSEREEYDRAIAYARCRLEQDTLNEAAHRGLMELYARAGQHTAAIRQYKLCTETLTQELGVPPSEESRWTEALGLARQHGGTGDVAMVQRWLSYAACASGDFDRAEALCVKSLEGFPEGNVYGSGVVTLALARVALFRGDPTRAAKLFQACLHDLQLARDWVDTVRALEGLAWAFAAVDNYENAAVLLGFLAAYRERSGVVLPPVDGPHHDRALSSTREALSQAAFAAAWAAGEALTLEEAVELGWDE